jgi:hypothetical protein
MRSPEEFACPRPDKSQPISVPCILRLLSFARTANAAHKEAKVDGPYPASEAIVLSCASSWHNGPFRR